MIYSIASPRRVNPGSGKIQKACLKTIGTPYTAKTLDTDRLIVHDITVEAATREEVADTISVMGGEDWEWWIDTLQKEDVLSPTAETLALSYIGPKFTFPIYRHGTIGRAKEHLEGTANRLRARLTKTGGDARIVVSKGLVTQASSAVPVMPLYISILYWVMKKRGLHEGCIEQMRRLYSTHRTLDDEGRIRIDDWEMRPEVQDEVESLWTKVTTDNVKDLADIASYQAEFLRLFGFGLAGVDYEREADPMLLSGEPAVTDAYCRVPGDWIAPS